MVKRYLWAGYEGYTSKYNKFQRSSMTLFCKNFASFKE